MHPHASLSSPADPVLVPLDPLLLDALHLWLRQHLPLVPDWISLAQLNEVLDIGCGMHAWGRDLYRLMSEQAGEDLVADVRIQGLEHHEPVVRAANAQARSSRGKVHALHGDMYTLPTVFTAHIDLVQVRFLSPWVSSTDWPRLLAHLAQACRPGGWLLWIEPEMPSKSEHSPAWNQWLDWMRQATRQHGGSVLSQQQRARLFEHAGPWQRMERRTSHLPLTTFSPLHCHMTEDELQPLVQWLHMLLPYLLAAHVTTPAQLAAGLQQVVQELRSRQVESVWTWQTISGQRTI